MSDERSPVKMIKSYGNKVEDDWRRTDTEGCKHREDPDPSPQPRSWNGLVWRQMCRPSQKMYKTRRGVALESVH